MDDEDIWVRKQGTMSLQTFKTEFSSACVKIQRALNTGQQQIMTPLECWALAKGMKTLKEPTDGA